MTPSSYFSHCPQTTAVEKLALTLFESTERDKSFVTNPSTLGTFVTPDKPYEGSISTSRYCLPRPKGRQIIRNHQIVHPKMAIV